MRIEQARNILGVTNSATKQEVRIRYRDLIKRWHPDISSEKDADKKMQEINSAFEMVMKEQFGEEDAFEDYYKWWLKQYARNDPIWGEPADDEQEERKQIR